MKAVKNFIILIAIGIAVVYLLSRLGCIGRNSGVTPVTVVTPPDTLHWTNKAGDDVTSLKGTAEAFAVLRKQVADSVAKAYEVKLKNMQEYLIAWTQSQTDIPPDTATRETDYIPSPVNDCPPVVKNMRQQFNSPYDSISVQIGDSAYLHKKSFDTVTVVWKTIKEGGLFNRKTFLQVDISFADTSRKVSRIDAYRKDPVKPKKFGIGLQFGGSYINNQWRPYAGAGISWNLIRF